MSTDYPNRTRWLAIRSTPANLYRTRGRVFFAGPGTYVRLTGDAKHWAGGNPGPNIPSHIAAAFRRRRARMSVLHATEEMLRESGLEPPPRPSVWWRVRQAVRRVFRTRPA